MSDESKTLPYDIMRADAALACRLADKGLSFIPDDLVGNLGCHVLALLEENEELRYMAAKMPTRKDSKESARNRIRANDFRRALEDGRTVINYSRLFADHRVSVPLSTLKTLVGFLEDSYREPPDSSEAIPHTEDQSGRIVTLTACIRCGKGRTPGSLVDGVCSACLEPNDARIQLKNAME